MALLPIIIVIFIAIFLLFFILKDFGMINKKQKILSGIALSIFGVFIGYYAYNKSQLDQKAYLLQMNFLRGGDIICENTIVNAKDFNLVTGTLTLIGKEKTPAKNLVFSLQNCKRAPNKESRQYENQELQEQLEKE
ncbi:hypothetical protein [Helicobacter anatolicus]|uniref:hypothetical protein n=1 Tax=Helicobacter anatolicus TaxID=2905874 RepID=UPI001E4DCC50|nr:hypothetical protein [Helicobacter anatolicus]MCE3040125.1 hypothetical protein [Helicobacter anatolicus]